MFKHNNASVHKLRSMKTWFTKYEMEELDRRTQNPDPNTTEQLWDEMKHRHCPIVIPTVILQKEYVEDVVM